MIKNGARRGMVEYDIDNHLHAPTVGCFNEFFEIVPVSHGWINRSIVTDRIRTSILSLTTFLSSWIDWHQPENICAESMDSFQILCYLFKSSFLGMIANKDRINHVLFKFRICLLCHKNHLSFLSLYFYLFRFFLFSTLFSFSFLYSFFFFDSLRQAID